MSRRGRCCPREAPAQRAGAWKLILTALVVLVFAAAVIATAVILTQPEGGGGPDPAAPTRTMTLRLSASASEAFEEQLEAALSVAPDALTVDSISANGTLVSITLTNSSHVELIVTAITERSTALLSLGVISAVSPDVMDGVEIVVPSTSPSASTTPSPSPTTTPSPSSTPSPSTTTSASPSSSPSASSAPIVELSITIVAAGTEAPLSGVTVAIASSVGTSDTAGIASIRVPLASLPATLVVGYLEPSNFVTQRVSVNSSSTAQAILVVLPQLPVGVASVSPTNGEDAVALTREFVVTFTRPISHYDSAAVSVETADGVSLPG